MNLSYADALKKFITHTNEKEKALKILKNFLTDKKYKNLLDIGCGTGYFSQNLSSFFDNLTGIDLELKIDKNQFENENFEFIEADFLQTDFLKKFDVILASYVLWEIPFTEWEHFFKKVKSILSREGVLLVIDEYAEKKYDNAFFNFDLNLNPDHTHDEYPDWYQYLNNRRINYKSYPFTSEIIASSAEEMYETLSFFFLSQKRKIFYEKNKEKIIQDLKTKQQDHQIIIPMRNSLDVIYF